MDTEKNGLFTVPVESHEQAMALLGRLTDVAEPASVFGDPITVDGQTVITAAEVNVGLGYGYGMGGGSEQAEEAEQSDDEPSPPPTGFGGGGGGGGSSTSRPVAVIHVNAEGVHVEPVVDVTKVALALLTTLGTIVAISAKIRKAYRKS